MLKTIDAILIAAMITGAAWTFKVKYEAEAIEAQVAALDRKAQLERETIALLDADWSLLNQPDRLQRLADAYKSDLGLEPIQPQQIVEAEELPLPPVQAAPEPAASSPKLADSSKTKVR
ncbi:hypothetical protein GCM10011390_08870 [Aureimonas endophytica]|uniref:Cell division protein FtsL n=1 Tax=Aureimonas endophytica TaxID=2027858 RepID=A0A917E2B2_9HYPH|nr:hypothetical protein [Aureimonas endophytica]GGD92394.1 hypothetical protein GCM10011390_08870 [Aureimonas endophytica]